MMIDLNRSRYPATFEVAVGHHRVRVEAWSHEDAIRQARRVLCLDMPRLYDVIRQLDRSRFAVQQLPTS